MQELMLPNIGLSPWSAPITKEDDLQVRVAKKAFRQALQDVKLPDEIKNTYGALIEEGLSEELNFDEEDTLSCSVADDGEIAVLTEEQGLVAEDESVEDIIPEEAEEEIDPQAVLEEKFPEIKSLKDGEIIIASQHLTIFLTPETVIEKENNVILVFNNANVNIFRVSSGASLALIYKNQGESFLFSVYYTGTEFSYLDKTFFVFYRLQATQD